ncbi:hypothetical protein B0T10DRAFT_164844 [Thelonectria olida]|uniref:Uncharacterized protein n=1 Tax=Thelonectria olida TaxID=1576542 RepID=A0A9P9ARI9_9HYPO|nr:hypothetical protein B0T10DRAFT_164844 [Thelonectria olida]
MPRSKSSRRRPATPEHKIAESQEDQHLTADPTSPPETPTTSPPASRKHSLKPRRQPDFRDLFKHRPLDEDPNIKPFGNGHQFSYRPTFGPDQLSPRSSSSSSSDLDESDDASSENASLGSVTDAPGPVVELDVDDSEDDSDEPMSDSATTSDSDDSDASEEEETSHLTVTTTTVVCNFTLEDVDPMDSDCDGLDILQPTEIESNRSRSRSRHRELDKDMMQDLKNLNCSNETSDNEESPDCEEEAFLRRREQLRKFRRMSMGSSFGKRTHSELSDSDSDGEALDVNDVGATARRFRRKMQRTSLLFHDPPPARIEELEEPDSSEDEWAAGQSLARELPYWGAIEIMEMDSS